jgi:citrate synthase
LLKINPAMRVIGYSASPYRLGHGMIHEGDNVIFDDLIEPVSIEQLVADGYLSTLRSKHTNLTYLTTGVKKSGGEFVAGELERALDTSDNNQAVVAETIERAQDRKSWLIFCSGVKHSKHIAQLLNENNISAACVTGETPSANLVRIADATMISLAEHGLVPSVQAARMTLAAAPESVQGAVAAGLLGCGPVILGASETAGHLLIAMLQQAAQEGKALEDIAKTRLQSFRANKQALPGFGHPTHKNGDPRATKLLDLAKEWGVAGEHVRALEVLASQVEGVYGRPFPMNVSAAIPAVLLDAGYPAGALKGIPLLARTASLVAHILEEQTRPIGFKLASAAEQAMTYDGPDATP